MLNQDNKILTKQQITEKFVREVEAVVKKNGFDYMDAIIHYCNKNNIEIETAASLVKSNLKTKTALQNQAQNLNYLPKPRSKLPL